MVKKKKESFRISIPLAIFIFILSTAIASIPIIMAFGVMQDDVKDNTDNIKNFEDRIIDIEIEAAQTKILFQEIKEDLKEIKDDVKIITLHVAKQQ